MPVFAMTGEHKAKNDSINVPTPNTLFAPNLSIINPPNNCEVTYP